MTRRFGTWMIGATLGLAPLAGCAGWGRSAPGGCRACETPTLLNWWARHNHAPSTPAPSMEGEIDPVVHETETPPPQEAAPDAPAIESQSPAVKTVTPEPIIVEPPSLLPPIPSGSAAPVEPKENAAPLGGLPLPPAVAAFANPEVVHREPLVDAMQAFIDNRQSEALQLLRKYDASTQEVFLRLLPILALMTQKSIDQLSDTEVAVLNDQVHGVNEALRPRSKLTIDKACFCEWIRSYGIYQPLPVDYAFHAATPSRPGERVKLYVELRNYARVEKNHLYMTRLEPSIEILDGRQKRAWYHDYDDQDPRIWSRTPLHDYCDSYTFYVPSTLSPGSYTLIIRVKDTTRPEQPREASQALEFRVTSMPRVP